MGVRIQHRAGGFCWNHQIWRGRALSKASKKQKGTRLGTRGSKLCPAGRKNPQIQPGVLCSTQPRSIPHQRQTGGTWGHTDPSPLSPSPGTLHSLEFWKQEVRAASPPPPVLGHGKLFPAIFGMAPCVEKAKNPKKPPKNQPNKRKKPHKEWVHLDVWLCPQGATSPLACHKQSGRGDTKMGVAVPGAVGSAFQDHSRIYPGSSRPPRQDHLASPEPGEVAAPGCYI